MRHFPIKWFLFYACLLTSCSSQATPLHTPKNSVTVTPFVFPTSQPSNTPFIPSPTRENAEDVVYSPNGLWVAKKYSESSSVNFDRVEIQNVNGSVLWKIPFEGAILGRDGNVWIEIPVQGEQWKGEPNPSIYIFDWSRDSQYLYYCYRLFADGYQPLMDKFDLQRIDVNTGVIEKVLPGTGDMDFLFSPNQEYLVYTRGQDINRRITIRKTGDETEQSISNPEWDREIQIGGFDWSPYNENELRFLTFSEDWEQIQVHFLDIKNMSTKLILEFQREELWFDAWLPNNVFRFKTLPDNEITEVDVTIPIPHIIGTATSIP
jgi:hypothetical protein